MVKVKGGGLNAGVHVIGKVNDHLNAGWQWLRTKWSFQVARRQWYDIELVTKDNTHQVQ